MFLTDQKNKWIQYDTEELKSLLRDVGVDNVKMKIESTLKLDQKWKWELKGQSTDRNSKLK